MIETDPTLLGRLKGNNAQEAWREFYQSYWGAILRYARKLGLNEHEAEEALQETMVALMRVLPEFAYDRSKGRFRNFLLTIVHRKSVDVLKRRERPGGVAWNVVAENTVAASDGREGTDEREAEARWRDSLLEEAIRRMREDPRYAEHTLGIFEAYVVERRSVEEVARRFRISENAVYQVRSRLLRRVKAEVARLRRNSGTE